MKTFAAAVLFILALGVAAPAQQPDPNALVREAGVAYRQQDYKTFVEKTEAARRIIPNNAVIMYNLACGYALTGKPERAMELLTALTRRKIDFGAANDPDFTSLRDRDDFKDLIRRLDTMFAPIHTSEPVFVTQQVDMIPEGMAIDPRSGDIYFGSMRSGEIFLVDRAGQLSRFASVADSLQLSSLGMEVDTIRNLLWALGTSSQQHAGFRHDTPNQAALCAFDLTSAATTHFHPWTDVPTGFGYNDLTVTTNGDIYIGGNAVYHLPAGDSTVQQLSFEPTLVGVNGLSFSEDERYLFVSSYGRGLARIELRTMEWAYLGSADTVELAGIDGLYYREGSLFAIQNGVQPWRAIRFDLNEARDSIIHFELLEFKNDSLTVATTGGLDGDWFYYVATGPAPTPIPSHLPANTHRILGKTTIMRAPMYPAP